MALKPFYNKKGHMGMTRAELLKKVNGNIFDPNNPNIANVTRKLSGDEYSDLMAEGGGSVTLADFPVNFDNMPEQIYFETGDPNPITIPLSLSTIMKNNAVPGYDDPVNISIYSSPPIRNMLDLTQSPWFYQYTFVTGLNIGVLERIFISFAQE